MQSNAWDCRKMHSKKSRGRLQTHRTDEQGKNGKINM